MLHPILESLFFLKVARKYVSESIKDSDVENKTDLISYIQNEASDYEVMHLVTLGQMPEEKFDSVTENVVWDIFRRAVVNEMENVKEFVDNNDVNQLIFECGPVSELGYSSASPILEFDQNQGNLANDFLNEIAQPLVAKEAVYEDIDQIDYSRTSIQEVLGLYGMYKDLREQKAAKKSE